MGTALTIGRLARSAGVPVSTLRYYERVELLVPGGRTDSNYRVYDDTAVDTVRFIRVAQAAGFSLDDIRTLLSLQREGGGPCDDVAQLIDRRLTELHEQLAELQEMERHLKQFATMCEKADGGDHCAVLDRLTAESAGESP